MSEYKTQIASDVVRDGLGVELLDSDERVVAEVFRCDRDHTVSMTTFGNEIPIQALHELLRRVEFELDPFEDGTPLSKANVWPL